jgi:hypothetical protein
VEQGD